MNLRTPNEHTEDNEAWKKRDLAFANYYTAHRAYEKVEQDFAASRDAKTRTDKAERDRQKADALANELHKLTTAWTKIDRKLGDEDEFADSDPAHISVYGLTKLKEPGDYQDINSGFTVRLSADGTIRPFAQKPNSPGHDHTDPHLDMMGVLKTNWNWESNYNKVFDFAASQCGASSVVIDFESPGRRSLGRVQQLLKMAGDRQLEVKLGPNFVEYLGYVTSNGRGSDAKMAAHIYDLVRQVNAKAEERKKDPEFLNSVESSILDQYARELESKDNKLPAVADGDDKTKQKTQFEEELTKKKDDKFEYDKTLAEIEKQLKGVDDGAGKKTGGFEARAKALASAEKELSTQLEAREKELEQLTKLEAEEAANPDAARRDEIEELKARITRLTEGEPGTDKSKLREGMIAGLEAETEDLTTRSEAMESILKNMKTELENGTPENARSDEQKKQLQQIESYLKTVTTQQKTLQGYMAEDGERSKLAEKNEKLVADVAELKDKGPRLGA